MPLSLLDRLTDLEPGVKQEASMSSWEEARTFRDSLCRDTQISASVCESACIFPSHASGSSAVLNHSGFAGPQ